MNLNDIQNKEKYGNVIGEIRCVECGTRKFVVPYCDYYICDIDMTSMCCDEPNYRE